MKTLKICLAISLVFVAGFAAGWAVSRALTRHAIARMLGHPNQLRLVVERRLTRRLRLDSAQHQRLEAILDHTQDDLKNLRGQFAPSFRTIMSNAQFEISGILTPEQRERFTQFVQENRGFWEPRVGARAGAQGRETAE